MPQFPRTNSSRMTPQRMRAIYKCTEVLWRPKYGNSWQTSHNKPRQTLHSKQHLSVCLAQAANTFCHLPRFGFVDFFSLYFLNIRGGSATMKTEDLKEEKNTPFGDNELHITYEVSWHKMMRNVNCFQDRSELVLATQTQWRHTNISCRILWCVQSFCTASRQFTSFP